MPSSLAHRPIQHVGRRAWHACRFLNTRGCAQGGGCRAPRLTVRSSTTLAGRGRRGVFSTPEGVRRGWSPQLPAHWPMQRDALPLAPCYTFPTPEGVAFPRHLGCEEARRSWQPRHPLHVRRSPAGASQEPRRSLAGASQEPFQQPRRILSGKLPTQASHTRHELGIWGPSVVYLRGLEGWGRAVMDFDGSEGQAGAKRDFDSSGRVGRGLKRFGGVGSGRDGEEGRGKREGRGRFPGDLQRSLEALLCCHLSSPGS